MFRTVFERVLWLIAVVTLGAFVWERAEAQLYQSHFDRVFSEALAARPPDATAAVRSAASRPGEPLGRVEIPSIDLSVIYVEGVDRQALRRAVGHIPGTAIPGGSGNVGLSAHRDTFFRRLGEIEVGDTIRVVTLERTYEYRVEATRIVNPDESIVLRDVGRPVLTLVTCYPFWYLGPAPKRFIVHAGLVS